MRMVIAHVIASCRFGQGQQNAATIRTAGDAALKGKAPQPAVSSLTLERRPSRVTRYVANFALAPASVNAAPAGAMTWEVRGDAAR